MHSLIHSKPVTLSDLPLGRQGPKHLSHFCCLPDASAGSCIGCERAGIQVAGVSKCCLMCYTTSLFGCLDLKWCLYFVPDLWLSSVNEIEYPFHYWPLLTICFEEVSSDFCLFEIGLYSFCSWLVRILLHILETWSACLLQK